MHSLFKASLFFLFIIGIGVAGAWYAHLHVKEKLPLIEAARGTALKEGPRVFADLATYPVATPRAERTEKLTAPSKGMWSGVKNRVVWEQEFEAPGINREMKDWFAKKLLAQGWKIWDPSDPSVVHTQWCKPHWLLTIQHNVTFETPPSYRFGLRLEWMWDFEAERCPLPKNEF